MAIHKIVSWAWLILLVKQWSSFQGNWWCFQPVNFIYNALVTFMPVLKQVVELTLLQKTISNGGNWAELVFQTWIWWNTITLPISDLLTLFGKSCPAKSIPKFEWRILGKEILWIRILVWKKLSSGISNVCHQQNYYVWLGLLFWINSTSLSMCYCPSLCHKIINVLM